MTAHSFKRRFLQVNGRLLAEFFRWLAHELDLVVPGPPSFASPVWFQHQPEGEVSMGAITVKDTDPPLSATVTFLDAKGNQTQPDDIPAWSSSDLNVASVVASEDGRSASVQIGNPGAAIIAVDTTDTDGTQVHSEGTVTVQPGEATVGDVEFQPGA